MVATGAKLQGDYRYGYGYGETPQPAADPHFLAASGGQAGGPPSRAKSGSSSGPADLRALPQDQRKQACGQQDGEREQEGARGGARRLLGVRDPSRQLLGGLCAAPGGPVGAIRSAAPPVRRRVALTRASAGQLDPHTEGALAPSCWSVVPAPSDRPSTRGNRILLARRAPGS